MFQYEYVRAGLKNGLKLEQQLGVNPFKVGMIGSTDSHTGHLGGRGGQLLRQGRRPTSRARTAPRTSS
jgi:hypothetical protein